ncbi:hypothetical protein GQ54DRAFT_296113 [Martensiomyces pterosporus]|nr:hypothetical protein GQ54DRAFT_296113 [Martensiomyces pterosporus]
MEKEILRLYQERIDKYDEVFCEVSRDINELKVSQRELTQLQWDNNKLSAEVSELRADITGLHRSLVKERQSHLDVVAENDALRIREHELERRVRILATVSAKYYNDNGSSISRNGSYSHDHSESSHAPAIAAAARPHKRQRQAQDATSADDLSHDEFLRKQLEIENESLQLSIETMRIQLQEQKTNYAEIIEGLNSEFTAYREATAKDMAGKTRRIQDLEAELDRVKGLYRENLRDLVVARKTALESKHSVKQDSLLLRSEILALQRRLDAEMEKSKFLQSTAVSGSFSLDEPESRVH